MTSHQYRPDIQIYRAVAVTLVLLFHFGIPGFSAGFLGVDIFFVISGYLMTTLHSKDASAREFYLRRARRLLPAYAATIAATLAAAFFITVPSDFSQVGTQVLYASALSSNIGFALQNSYFSSFEFNPLLHLWSLAVECQFYLIFPFLIAAIRRWRWLLLPMILVSLCACLAGVMISPKLSFFLLPMRIWEFGVGIWVAGRPAGHRADKEWVGAAALAVLATVPMLPIDGEVRDIVFGHPAFGAIVVSIATGIALSLGQPSRLTNSVAGTIAQRLGDYSYSIYLAHWPVLVLAHYEAFGGTRSEVTSVRDAVLCLLLVIGTSAALYRLCERRGPRLFTPRRAAVTSVGLAAAAILLVQLQVQRFELADKLAFAAMKDRSYIRCGKVFRLINPGEQLCQISEGNKGTVFLIGDSFSDSLKESFAASATRAGLRSYFAVDNQPLISIGLNAGWLASEIRARHAQAVYLHFTTEHFAEGVLAAAKEASVATGARVTVVLPPPVYDENIPQQIYLGNGARVANQTLRSYRDTIHSVAEEARNLGFDVLEIAPAFCKPLCEIADEAGRPLYFDHAHLTLTGARRLESLLFVSLKQ